MWAGIRRVYAGRRVFIYITHIRFIPAACFIFLPGLFLYPRKSHPNLRDPHLPDPVRPVFTRPSETRFTRPSDILNSVLSE